MINNIITVLELALNDLRDINSVKPNRHISISITELENVLYRLRAELAE